MRVPRTRAYSSSGPKDEPGTGELNWFLQPHEIIALVLTVTLVVYVVFTRDTSDTAANVKACVTRPPRPRPARPRDTRLRVYFVD